MNLFKRSFAEFLGTCGLLIVVVGSGIMGETLSQGNMAVALLANSIATGAGLFALIQIFAEISGAYFNPAVALVELLQRKLKLKEFLAYCTSQIIGAIIGVWLTHFMFGLPILQLSTHDRNEPRLIISEAIATFGLILTITLAGQKGKNKNLDVIPYTVAAYITAAYWCTSSTSFANPAVTIARALSNTFAGIAISGVGFFIIAQVIGALIAFWTTNWLNRTERSYKS